MGADTDYVADEDRQAVPTVNSGLNTADQISQVAVRGGLMSGTPVLDELSVMECTMPLRTEVLPGLVFQAQLDSIDEELVKYNKVEEDRECVSGAQLGGVGSRAVGSTKFLKKFFTQTEPSGQSSPTSRFNKVMGPSVLASEVFEIFPSKCMGQDSEKELVEGFDRRKRRVIGFDIPMVEAAEKPC